MPKIIAHLDMDAFFASVEERDKPYLRVRTRTAKRCVLSAFGQAGS